MMKSDGFATHKGTFLLLVLLFMLGAGVALGDSLKGKVKNNVYYSPANNFTVPVPAGLMGMKVNDAYSKEGVGAVSFHNDFGNQTGIHYAPASPETIAKLGQPGSQEEVLKGSLHEVAMPGWFSRAVPNARVVHEATASFQEMSVLLALVDLPEGSVAMDMRTNKRLDSRRGLVIFSRGRYIYMLTIETMNAFAVAQRRKPGEDDPDWMNFTKRLESFYGSITFTE